MTEYTFTLYHQSGIPVTFNVTPSPEMLRNISDAIQKALADGWAASEPKPGEGEKVERVCGYVVGEYKDGKSGSYQPCVWLYPDSPVLEHPTATVYPENFDKLPFPVGKPEWDGAAPLVGMAREKKKLYPWKAEIIKTPKIGKDGEVLLTDQGNVKYKFVAVKSSQSVEQPPSHIAKLVQAVKQNPPTKQTRTTDVNVTDKQCPECFAPPQKLHRKDCSMKTVEVEA